MESIPFIILRHHFDDIFETIFFEWDIRMIKTVGSPDTCIEKSIKIIYLSDRTNRRSGIVRHGLLMNSNCRGESLDLTYMSRLRDI
jgi:hypothetical protein